METRPSAAELESRRRLAVRRVPDGYSQKDVAASLGVSAESVAHWMAADRAAGDDGRAAPTRPRPGAEPKLSRRRGRSVLSWLAESPQAFGYATDLWTTRRLAEVIEERFGVRFDSSYLAGWLTRRGLSPRKPEVAAVERGNPAIARWVAEDGPRIEGRPRRGGPTSS